LTILSISAKSIPDRKTTGRTAVPTTGVIGREAISMAKQYAFFQGENKEGANLPPFCYHPEYSGPPPAGGGGTVLNKLCPAGKQRIHDVRKRLAPGGKAPGPQDRTDPELKKLKRGRKPR